MFTNSQNKLSLGTVFNPTLGTSAYVVGNIFPVTLANAGTNNTTVIRNAFFYNVLELIISATPSSGNSINWYIEFSNDGVIWGREVSRAVSAGVSTDTGTVHTIASATTTPLRYIYQINDQFIRIGAEAVTSATNATFSVQATLGNATSYNS